MNSAESYRAKAAEMIAKAQAELSPLLRGELMRLAQAYLRLAQQADQNARNDIVYEAPERHQDDRGENLD